MTNYETQRGKATSTVQTQNEQSEEAFEKSKERGYGPTWNDGSTWHQPSTSTKEPLDATTPSTTTS